VKSTHPSSILEGADLWAGASPSSFFIGNPPGEGILRVVLGPIAVAVLRQSQDLPNPIRAKVWYFEGRQ